MRIIPWHCHICGSKFAAPDGGLCSRCSKATCRSCLIPELNKKQMEAKEASVYVCRHCATPEELKKAPPFKKVRFGSPAIDDNGFKKTGLILRKVAIAIIILVAFGFLIDLFSGLYVLRHSKSIYADVAGLLILAIFYAIGEAGSEWIGGKDDVAHPLHKRVFLLLALVLFAAFIMVAIWFSLKSLGIVRI